MGDNVLARLFVALDLDTRGLNSAGKAVQGVTRDMGNAFSHVASAGARVIDGMAKVGFAIFGVQQIAATAKNVIQGLFSSNIQFEAFETQFITLLGSAEAAQQRMAELEEFGRSTPFELPGVVEASRILQVFGGSALATGDNLRLVGDIAAGTGRPFEEVALWVGRLNDALANGRPAGEAMARLQEMGAISGATRGEIERLAESGSGLEALAFFSTQAADTWGGNMDRLSKTTAGSLSNIADGFEGAKRRLMEGFFNAVSPLLAQFAATLGSEEFQNKVTGWGVLLGNVIEGKVLPRFTELVEFIQTNGPEIGRTMQEMWENIVRPVLMNFATGLGIVFDAAHTLWDFMVANKPVMIAVLVAVGAAFVAAFGGVPLLLAGVITALGYFKNNWRDLWNGAVGIVEGALNLMISGLNKFIDKMGDFIEMTLNPILTALQVFGIGNGPIQVAQGGFIPSVHLNRVDSARGGTDSSLLEDTPRGATFDVVAEAAAVAAEAFTGGIGGGSGGLAGSAKGAGSALDELEKRAEAAAAETERQQALLTKARNEETALMLKAVEARAKELQAIQAAHSKAADMNFANAMGVLGEGFGLSLGVNGLSIGGGFSSLDEATRFIGEKAYAAGLSDAERQSLIDQAASQIAGQTAQREAYEQARERQREIDEGRVQIGSDGTAVHVEVKLSDDLAIEGVR